MATATIHFENNFDAGVTFSFDIDMVNPSDADLNDIADSILAMPFVQSNFTSPAPWVDSIYVPTSRSVTVT